MTRAGVRTDTGRFDASHQEAAEGEGEEKRFSSRRAVAPDTPCTASPSERCTVRRLENAPVRLCYLFPIRTGRWQR